MYILLFVIGVSECWRFNAMSATKAIFMARFVIGNS